MDSKLKYIIGAEGLLQRALENTVMQSIDGEFI